MFIAEWRVVVWGLLPLFVSRDRNASCVCGECWLEWADEAVSMSLAPCPSPSSQVWLVGAAWGGAVSMSLFNRLSADCDFKSRVLSTSSNNNNKAWKSGTESKVLQLQIQLCKLSFRDKSGAVWILSHSPVRHRPFFRGELRLPTGITGKGQRKSLWSLFNAETKSSTRATRFRSRHNQPMSSKPSCAEKHPRSRRRTCSRRCRAWRQSIISIYMFSAHSTSRLPRMNARTRRYGESGNI